MLLVIVRVRCWCWCCRRYEWNRITSTGFKKCKPRVTERYRHSEAVRIDIGSKPRLRTDSSSGSSITGRRTRRSIVTLSPNTIFTTTIMIPRSTSLVSSPSPSPFHDSYPFFYLHLYLCSYSCFCSYYDSCFCFCGICENDGHS